MRRQFTCGQTGRYVHYTGTPTVPACREGGRGDARGRGVGIGD